MDRIDMHVEVPAVTLGALKGAAGEPTAPVAERVRGTRTRQDRRLAADGAGTVNAAMTDRQMHAHCRLESAARKLLDGAFEQLGLSARAMARILKVSRTLADLVGRETIAAGDVAEAIQYRTLDRRLTS